MKIRVIVLLLMVLLSVGFAQESETVWKFEGQAQVRTELDGRDFSNATYMQLSTNMRTRLGLTANISKKSLFYVQVQDSRVYGEEVRLDTNTKNAEIHQAYVKLTQIFELPVNVQVGRFELSFGTERLFSGSQWSYIGKTWDGLRVTYGEEVKVDFFALTKNKGISYVSTAGALSYDYPAKLDSGSSVYGLWLNAPLNKENKLDVFAYYDAGRAKSDSIHRDLSQTTLGLNYRGLYGPLSSVAEAVYQAGKKGAAKVSSFLLSAQGIYKYEALKLGAGIDIVSGTDPNVKDKYNTFAAPYGTTHKLYGNMDYFYEGTKNYSLGLNDVYITTNLNPENTKFSYNLYLHFLNSNKSTTSGSYFGRELDLVVNYEFIKGTNISWGGSAFLPGHLMETVFKTAKGSRTDTAYWSYVMVTANF